MKINKFGKWLLGIALISFIGLIYIAITQSKVSAEVAIAMCVFMSSLSISLNLLVLGAGRRVNWD